MSKSFDPASRAFNTFSTMKPISIAGHTGTLWMNETSLLLANETHQILHLPLNEIRHVTVQMRSAELVIDTTTNEQYVLQTHGVPAKALWARRTVNFLVGLADILSTNHGGSNKILDEREHKSVLLHWEHQLRERGVSVAVVKGIQWWPYGNY